MMHFSFITLIFYGNYGTLEKKYDILSKRQIEQSEFIFVLNKHHASKPIAFDTRNKSLLKYYDVHPDLIKIAQRLNAKFVVPSINGFSTARNQGASFAKNDYLIFSDEDVIPSNNWFQVIEKSFMEKDCDICFGPDEVHNEGNLWTWWRNQYELHFSTRNQIHTETKITSSNFFSCAGRNIAIKRSSFNKLKGYNPAFNHFFGEDLDLLIRAIQKKFIIWFLPAMCVQHIHPVSFYGLLRKFWLGGKADANWVLHHRSKMELNRVGKHYFSPVDSVIIFVSILLLVYDFLAGIVFILVYGLAKFFHLLKRKDPSIWFILLSTIMLPIKSALTMVGFFYELIKHRFLMQK